MRFKDSYAILDLDHTLINTETSEQPNPVLEKHCDFHFKLQGINYYVFKRPGVDQFLDTLIKNFKGIAVWTAAVATYAKQVIKGLFGISKAPNLILIWTRSQTQNDQNGLYKALAKLWKDPVYGKYMNANNTVHIDNTASVMRYNHGQALLVPDFLYYKVIPATSSNNGGNNNSSTGKMIGKKDVMPVAKKIVFNTGDNYLIYLNDLTNELIRVNQTDLKNYIMKANLLTSWYIKSHPHQQIS